LSHDGRRTFAAIQGGSTVPFPRPGIWLVTGASSGLGRAIALAALDAGHTVVLAARHPEKLDEICDQYPDRAYGYELDVTRPEQAETVLAAVEHRFGRLDVLVNNAGHGQVGAAEETTEDELRSIFEVHFFGPAALVKAVLPGMRERGGGAIVQVSSSFGAATAPGLAAYSASKFALEGYTGALAAEVATFGIDVLMLEPGAFRTGILAGAFQRSAEMPEYGPTAGKTRQLMADLDGTQPGDPARAAGAVLEALETDPVPLRLALGGDAVDSIRENLTGMTSELDSWETVSRRTAFDS
jgi:NAD(P)-dependent dehydrogenase (short-subunit alcohol dehydrogenase family)